MNDFPHTMEISADPAAFAEKGFVILQELIPRELCEALNSRLECLLNGDYDLGVAPKKVPGAKELRRFQSGGAKVTTLRVVDAWKADAVFHQVVTSRQLGQLAASLGGWSGARVAEDQVWIKPPGAGPLVFHRDSPYFDFEPDDVITIWIALDDMTMDLGPLEYVVGSHRWGGRRGTAAQFFDASHRQLMEDAARHEGIHPNEIDVVPVLVPQGGAGCHNGRLWHGSGPNQSKRCRRGLGIHFVPENIGLLDELPYCSLARLLSQRALEPYVLFRLAAENVLASSKLLAFPS